MIFLFGFIKCNCVGVAPAMVALTPLSEPQKSRAESSDRCFLSPPGAIPVMNFFDAVLTPETTDKHKPHPGAVFIILAKWYFGYASVLFVFCFAKKLAIFVCASKLVGRGETSTLFEIYCPYLPLHFFAFSANPQIVQSSNRLVSLKKSHNRSPTGLPQALPSRRSNSSTAGRRMPGMRTLLTHENL